MSKNKSFGEMKRAVSGNHEEVTENISLHQITFLRASPVRVEIGINFTRSVGDVVSCALQQLCIRTNRKEDFHPRNNLTTAAQESAASTKVI